MKTVLTQPPSFPQVDPDQSLSWRTEQRFQVLCGDADHWRVGIYSPPESRGDECSELERHSCPELFLLLTGRLVLVIVKNGKQTELELIPNQPVLVESPHCGYCPDGPHTGVALVVERDAFETQLQPVADWLELFQ